MDITSTESPPATAGLTEARKQFLHNIFTTAIEGGINYWADVEAYHWLMKGHNADTGEVFSQDDLDSFYAVITPGDEDWGVSHLATGHGLGEREPVRIDIDVVIRGVDLFRRYCLGEINSHGEETPSPPLRPDHYWNQFLAAEATDGEDGDYDAEVADNIVQFGLFSQVVYG